MQLNSFKQLVDALENVTKSRRVKETKNLQNCMGLSFSGVSTNLKVLFSFHHTKKKTTAVAATLMLKHRAGRHSSVMGNLVPLVFVSPKC